MEHLTELMALFWTFAEGIILLAVRRGVCAIEGRRAGRGDLAMLGLGLCATAAMLFGWPLVASLLGGGDRTDDLCGWAVWGMMCAVWVALEGAIAVCVARAYGVIAGRRARRRGLVVASAFVGWMVFFLFYHWQAAQVSLARSLDSAAIENLAAFWVRICGVLWIAIEWAVAVYGWKTWRLLRGRA